MNLRKLYYLMLIIPLLFFYTGCSETTDPPVTVNESEVLVKYLETNGNPVSTYPVMIKATAVNSNILEGKSQTVIDIRNQEDFNKGHIKGAVNVNHKEVLAYYETNNLKDKETVVIACYSGQTAGWVTSLLRMMGYTNVKDLKWGMSSWNDATATAWKNNTSNTLATSFVTTATAKPAKGKLPKISTGKKTGKDILRARVEATFAEGFANAKVANNAVSGFHVANYWKESDYNWGHLNGAMQYSPKMAFTSAEDLKTLPTDKTIGVYCYTGQTSAQVTAYLRVLGYNAKSIVYGVNGMAYDTMPGTKFYKEKVGEHESDIHDYELVK